MSEGYSSMESDLQESLIRIEILTYFHRNPGLESSASELASATGRDKGTVKRQMDKLVDLGILCRGNADEVNFYTCSSRAAGRER